MILAGISLDKKTIIRDSQDLNRNIPAASTPLPKLLLPMKNKLYQFLLLFLFGFSFQASAKPEGEKTKPYRFRAGDDFKLTVFQQPDLTKSLTIGQDGKVSIPTIKQAIPLRGLTLKEAEQRVRQALSKGGANPTPIALKMLEYSQEFVHVSGAVYYPGAIEIP